MKWAQNTGISLTVCNNIHNCSLVMEIRFITHFFLRGNASHETCHNCCKDHMLIKKKQYFLYLIYSLSLYLQLPRRIPPWKGFLSKLWWNASLTPDSHLPRCTLLLFTQRLTFFHILVFPLSCPIGIKQKSVAAFHCFQAFKRYFRGYFLPIEKIAQFVKGCVVFLLFSIQFL